MGDSVDERRPDGPNQTLNDLAELLEAVDDAEGHVTRALARLRSIVPYARCAVYDAPPGVPPRLIALPAPAPAELEELEVTMLELFRRLAQRPAQPWEELSASGMRLAVPLLELGRVVGALVVERTDGVYDQLDARILVVVGGNLAAYFSMLRASAGQTTRADDLTRARVTADAAERVKNEFLSLVSHELRTPLTAILGWADALRSEDAPRVARLRAVEAIERAVRAQAKLVGDLLDLACIAAATLRLELSEVDPAQVVTAALAQLAAQARLKSIELVAELDETAVKLTADPSRLGQIVVALVGNAIKFTPPGGRVEVRVERETLLVRIRVTDTGVGISPALLPKLFEPFRQLDSSSTREQGGLGIGLALVKELAGLHGGLVNVASAGLGLGSTFTVVLPLAGGSLPAGALSPAPVDTATKTRPRALSGIRVLIVDDDRDIGEVLQFVLEAQGALVSVALSAAEALKSLKFSMPDVLLSDLAMPGGSGYELMRDIVAREGRRAPPAAALSAYAPGQDVGEALSAGFRMLLEKPIDSDTLINAVTALAAHALDPALRIQLERALVE